MSNWNSLFRNVISCAVISEPITNWLEANWKITSLTEYSVLATWHRHLDRISKSNDVKQAWPTLRSLLGDGSHTTGKSVLYGGRVYVSHCAMASAFVQEYEKICCHKSDKDSAKAVMDLRHYAIHTHCPVAADWIDFSPGVLQQVLSQLKAG